MSAYRLIAYLSVTQDEYKERETRYAKGSTRKIHLNFNYGRFMELRN